MDVVLALAGGKRLHVFNVHLRAPLGANVPGQKSGPFAWKSVSGWAEGFFISAVKRAGQAMELRLAVERVLDAEPDALIAVSGDFNAEDRSTALHLSCAGKDAPARAICGGCPCSGGDARIPGSASSSAVLQVLSRSRLQSN